MKIFVGTDHNGFYLKAKLLDYLTQRGYATEDVSAKELDPNDDFP